MEFCSTEQYYELVYGTLYYFKVSISSVDYFWWGKKH
jgi:hypothetical protein